MLGLMAVWLWWSWQWFVGETSRWEGLVKARVVEDDRMQHLHHATLTLPDLVYTATSAGAVGGNGVGTGAAARRGRVSPCPSPQGCSRRRRRRGMVTVKAPAYLRERVEEGTALPWVQFHEAEAQAERNNAEGDPGDIEASRRGQGEAQVLGAVLRHVVLQMKDDPFRELMGFMRLR